MQLVTQPPKSGICGHCCTTMVLDHFYPHLGFDVATVIQEVGHRHGTHFEELQAVLDRFYIATAPGKPVLATTVLPEMCLLSYRYRKTVRSLGGHWVLVYRGTVYCPGQLAPVPGEAYQQLYPDSMSLMTYYEVLGYKTTSCDHA